MKAAKLAFLSTVAVLANMARLLAQDFGVIKIEPPYPWMENGESEVPPVLDNMVNDEIITRIEDSEYFVVDYGLLEQRWEDSFGPSHVVMEDGSILRDGAAFISSFQKLKLLAGEDRNVNVVNILGMTTATQDNTRVQDK